jgi:hypothetical protein
MKDNYEPKGKKEDTGISARCLPEGRKCAVGTSPIDYLSYLIYQLTKMQAERQS